MLAIELTSVNRLLLLAAKVLSEAAFGKPELPSTTNGERPLGRMAVHVVLGDVESAGRLGHVEQTILGRKVSVHLADRAPRDGRIEVRVEMPDATPQVDEDVQRQRWEPA